jgi:hypothetical protein
VINQSSSDAPTMFKINPNLVDHHPILISSPPGCGKTAAVADAAKWLSQVTDDNYTFITLVVANTDPVDLLGCITIQTNLETGQKESVRAIPYWLQQASQKACLILLDEFTAASKEQQAAALKIADDSRELEGVRLHPKTIIIAAINPPDMAAGAACALALPVISRFEHVTTGPEHAIEWMKKQDSIIGVVGLFLQQHPDLALPSIDQWHTIMQEQKPYPCPRSWTRAARAYPHNINEWDRFVGVSAAFIFLEWAGQLDTQKNHEIILHGRLPPLPLSDKDLYVMAQSLVNSAIIKNQVHIDHIVNWLLHVHHQDRTPVVRSAWCILTKKHLKYIMKSSNLKKALIDFPELKEFLIN